MFADFLAARSAATLEVAPGITTPRHFGDAHREHLATRRAAGLFDFSFMCCTEITGAAGAAFLDSLQTRRLDWLQTGRIAYTLVLRDDGSVLNDATVWRLAADRYWLMIGRRSDFGHIERHAKDFDVTVSDASQQYAVIAIQGDASWPIIGRCFAGQPCAALPYYGFQQLDFAGTDCWLARIGYSGETGYELVIADSRAPALWLALLTAGIDAGLAECGFDAIDSLRIEAGHILFTRELAAPVTPVELGLARFVDLYRAPFRGAQALRRRQAPRQLAGLLPAADTAADACWPVHIASGSAIVTSSCWSPLYERCLGLGFVNAEDAYPGTAVRLHSGMRAQVARLPFYDPARLLPRRTH